MANGYGIANIKVIGVGGCGNNAVNRMIFAKVNSAEFINANTDLQALNASKASLNIQLGPTVTKGLGAGSDPEIGARAAEESKEEIKDAIKDADMLFITAGMGGGTGTGAVPIIAQMAQEMGILTVAVVTKPFAKMEGERRMENANKGIEKLKPYVDTLLVIPNERLQDFVPKGTQFIKAFQVADDVLRQAIQGVTDIIATPSLINLDFADIKTIMKSQGYAHIGIGHGSGENRTLDAVRQAVQSPLLETNIQGATGIIVHVTGGMDLTMEEVNDSVSLIREVVDSKANIIFGMGIDDTLDESVVITVVATGFDVKADGTSKYKTIQKPIFDKEQADKKMEKIYGFDSGSDEKEEDSKQNNINTDSNLPPSRMNLGEDKSIPSFVKRMKNKR
ncbi:MAG TPA: cell division protein FtsZ [Clostridiales bacterium]|nr:cell division protein FtsZ [Clostridiales bacterium]